MIIMGSVTYPLLLLMTVIMLHLLQQTHGDVTTSWTCPKSCICTSQGAVYCDLRNLISVTSTMKTDDLYINSQNKKHNQNLLDQNIQLSHNQLRTIFKDVLQQMPTAKIVDLSDNMLHCDCELLSLKKYLIDNMNNQLPNNIGYKCTSPPSLKGQRLKDITSHDLNCPVDRLARQRRKAGNRRKLPTYTPTPVDYCMVNHCINDGVCVLRDGSSICLCPLSYNGVNCEIRSEPQLQVYAKQLPDKTVQVNWTLDRDPLNTEFNLEMKTADGIRLIQSQMLPSEMRQMTIEGPFLTTRVRVCVYIYENDIITNTVSCRKIYIDERGYGLPPPSDLPDDKIYNPYDASNFNEVIDKASIALGSIIGLCGLLILGLAIAYKNRQLDSDNNANMPVDINGLSSAYAGNTIIQLQTIRESYEEEGQEATLADASQVPIVETTGEALNMNNSASTIYHGARHKRSGVGYNSRQSRTQSRAGGL